MNKSIKTIFRKIETLELHSINQVNSLMNYLAINAKNVWSTKSKEIPNSSRAGLL